MILAFLLGIVRGGEFGMLEFRARDDLVVDARDDFFHDRAAFRRDSRGLFSRHRLLGHGGIGRVRGRLVGLLKRRFSRFLSWGSRWRSRILGREWQGGQ